MTAPLATAHGHIPLYRVVQKDWEDPLDASFSQVSPDRRWNTPEFPALYCCCSERVARVVAIDRFLCAAWRIEDIQPAQLPRLVEFHWTGHVVDVATDEGVSAAGFDASYPGGSNKEQTRKLAAQWHAQLAQGVVCRSASMWRLGFSRWLEPHEQWSEIAIFVRNCDKSEQPRDLTRRPDLDWLTGS